MTVEEEREAVAKDRKRKAQRTINAYHVTFSGPDGKAVLQDIVSCFGINASTFLPSTTRPGDPLTYDPFYGAIRSGQRDVYLHIMAKLDAPMTGDANIVEGNKVLTGLSE